MHLLNVSMKWWRIHLVLSFMMLGDAYVSIQERDRAVEAYEQALKCNLCEATLACKMGMALVKTHQYGKVINYYKEL